MASWSHDPAVPLSLRKSGATDRQVPGESGQDSVDITQAAMQF